MKKRLIKMPKIVCLCGSTRFRNEFQIANYEESIKGNIVLSVGFYAHQPETIHTQELGCTPEQKILQDELHKRKIDLSDEVLVLNIGGYIGDSTRSEIEYAINTGTPVRYKEPIYSTKDLPLIMPVMLLKLKFHVKV